MLEPTILQKLKRPRIYGEKEERVLWEQFHKWGRAASGPMLRRWANSQGMYSPKKGEVSHMGPIIAMWRYAFKHPKEAYPAWEKWTKESYQNEAMLQGIEINFETFLKVIKEQVERSHIYVDNTLEDWCQKWGVK